MTAGRGTLLTRPGRCSACDSYPCVCRKLAERRPRRPGPIREECVCGGPDLVAVTFLAGDIVDAVQRHQIEPLHIAWDLAHGIPLSSPQAAAWSR